MKKITASFFAFLFIMSNGNLYSAPTYGTEMPPKNSVTTGYQFNRVFKHELNDSYGNITSTQNFYDISYGVFEWLSVEGKIGLGDIFRKGGNHPKVYYRTGFAGGYGFRIKAFEHKKYDVKTVLGFHHISVHPVSKNLDNDKYDAILDDWQVSLTASKSIDRLTPYVGIKASEGDLITRTNEIDRKRRPPRNYLGLIVGGNVWIKKNLYVNVESRFFDENALTAGIYYTF